MSHVASPHALWIDDELYLYFDGENTRTRPARSTDGVRFTYDKVIIDTAMVGPDVTETSYARVFRRSVPHLDARYVVFVVHGEHHGQPATDLVGLIEGYPAPGARGRRARHPGRDRPT